MRKLIVSIHSTANNIVTGPPAGDETDFGRWARRGIGDTLDTFMASLEGVDTIILGRGTYEDLVRKWPKVDTWPNVSDATQQVAEKINSAPKYVVSGTLQPDDLTWGKFEPPTLIAGTDAEAQIRKLKRGKGGDIITFGSPVLVQSLVNARLADEYRIIVHPVIMHEGRRLFDNLEGRTNLKLVDVDTFAGGAMIVTYARAKA